MASVDRPDFRVHCEITVTPTTKTVVHGASAWIKIGTVNIFFEGENAESGAAAAKAIQSAIAVWQQSEIEQ